MLTPYTRKELMASLMENLLEVLDREETKYEELVKLEYEKKEILIKGDVPALEKMTDREQDVSSVLRNLEIRREKIMDDMSTVLGKKKSELTIKYMIGILDKQPDEQARLSELREKLRATLSEMSQINELNRMLTEQAIELVEYDLNLIKSMRQAPQTANYDRDALGTGDILPSRGFDAKQ